MKPTKDEVSDWSIVMLSPVEVDTIIGLLNWSHPTAVVPGGRKIVRRVNSITVGASKSLLPFCPVTIEGTPPALKKKIPSTSRNPKPSGTLAPDSKSIVFRFCEAALKEARSRNTAASARLSDAQQTRTRMVPETNSFTTELNIKAPRFCISLHAFIHLVLQKLIHEG